MQSARAEMRTGRADKWQIELEKSDRLRNIKDGEGGKGGGGEWAVKNDTNAIAIVHSIG